VTRRQGAERQRAKAHPAQAQHATTHRLHHAPDLAIAALVDHKAQQRILAHTRDLLNHGSGGGARRVVQHHAGLQAAQRLLRHITPHQRLVLFVHAVAGVGQPISQVAVVRQQQQSFAIGIQATHRVDARRARHQRDHRGAALRVIAGAENADRLVQQIRDPFAHLDGAGRAQRLTVHGDRLAGGVHARAQLGHHHPIHRDAPRADQGFGGPARSHAGVGQHFL